MTKQMFEVKKQMNGRPHREWWRDGSDAANLFAVLWNRVTAIQSVEALARADQRNTRLCEFLHVAEGFGVRQAERVRVGNLDGLFEVSRLEWAADVLAQVLEICAEAGFACEEA